jgi:hypothetical protein
MKETYVVPEFTVINFTDKDVVTASDNDLNPGDFSPVE